MVLTVSDARPYCLLREMLLDVEAPTEGALPGAWVAQWVKPLPSAQVMISGSWDRGPHRALCSAGSLLPPLSLPASLPTFNLLTGYGSVQAFYFFLVQLW